MKKSFLFLGMVLFFYSCGSPEPKPLKKLTQTDLIQKAKEIIESKKDFEEVVNFNEVDSSKVLFHEVNLLDSIENEIVGTVFGYTGCSSGCSGNLLLVFHPQNHELIYAEQTPAHLEFIDIDNDGIHEVYTENFILWMGACDEHFSLYSLNSKKNLFMKSNHSPDNCDIAEDELSFPVDTMLKSSTIVFKDLDNDQIKEVLITTKIRLFAQKEITQQRDTLKLKI